MESLNNYIVERIRIDNVKHPGFPINGTLEEIADFLKEQGFKEIKERNIGSLFLYDFVVPFNDYGNKCFHAENTFICFADTSKDIISKSNMLYYIDMDGGNFFKIWDDDLSACKLLDKNEFKKEMESYFN